MDSHALTAIERPGFRFYFPITTSLLLSGLLSLAVFLVKFFRR